MEISIAGRQRIGDDLITTNARNGAGKKGRSNEDINVSKNRSQRFNLPDNLAEDESK